MPLHGKASPPCSRRLSANVSSTNPVHRLLRHSGSDAVACARLEKVSQTDSCHRVGLASVRPHLNTADTVATELSPLPNEGTRLPIRDYRSRRLRDRG